MQYSIFEGKRLNSLKNLKDGYRYSKSRESNCDIYFRCTLTKLCNCPGLANITATSSLFEVTNMHNHSPSEYMSDSIVLANRIKRAAESSTDGLREILNNECRNAPGESYLTFKKLERSMCKSRRVELPKLPISPEEIVELLIDSPISSNHKLTIRDGIDTPIMFATDLMISKLVERDTIILTWTFKVVPYIFC